jgi:hypothetical protein
LAFIKQRKFRRALNHPTQLRVALVMPVHGNACAWQELFESNPEQVAWVLVGADVFEKKQGSSHNPCSVARSHAPTPEHFQGPKMT